MKRALYGSNQSTQYAKNHTKIILKLLHNVYYECVKLETKD